MKRYFEDMAQISFSTFQGTKLSSIFADIFMGSINKVTDYELDGLCFIPGTGRQANTVRNIR
jgi:hypothetical protein